ncbi:universal stress protein [Confluentibacter flavum]|uniref:Universal stress protein UspA n=1 Tax=Confluentibacter flavum TaxID=1909700 RepID=A0A2N3HLU5_9FLAO|nr:universal stress protein [Confluentibacter flavum]PKQ45933.1 universal stress protein UspA [Confluentibacter flavum]
MKNILVPLGTSTNSISHLQYAIDLAESFGAKLFVVQTYNVYTKAGTMVNVDAILARESKAYLDDLISKVDTKGVDYIVKSLKGDLIDTLELVSKAADIDLILIEPRTNSIKEEVFLGKTSGKIIKQTQIPALIVPEATVFKPIHNILMAVKSAIIKKEGVLSPLKHVKDHFKATVDLLLVKTHYYNEGDFDLSDELKNLISNTIFSENPTTYQGVLEHYREHNPDMLCVVRRKRGFFSKLWEKNEILKKDFSSTIPVLVLSELK